MKSDAPQDSVAPAPEGGRTPPRQPTCPLNSRLAQTGRLTQKYEIFRSRIEKAYENLPLVRCLVGCVLEQWHSGCARHPPGGIGRSIYVLLRRKWQRAHCFQGWDGNQRD